MEFHAPSDLSQLPQKVAINCTGYGARALWKDESVVPVRGQIAWLIPQPEVNYGVFYKNINILARRDGIVVQDGGRGDMEGYNDTNEQPDRPAAEAAVRVVAELYRRMNGGAPNQAAARIPRGAHLGRGVRAEIPERVWS